MQTESDIGALAPFHTAGILELPDVLVASGLLRMAGSPALASNADTMVALAVALCVRALRAGSVCVDIASDPAQWLPAEAPLGPAVPAASGEPPPDPPALPWPDPKQWRDALAGHQLVAEGVTGSAQLPVRLVGTLVYLQRYWQDEQLIRTEVALRSCPGNADPAAVAAAVELVFGASPPDPSAQAPDHQREAAAAGATSALTILAGGPGTGKTTTVARIMAVSRALDPNCRIALAAPTGKAAARLTAAVAQAELGLDPRVRWVPRSGEVTAMTIHRLLGWRPDSRTRFRHDSFNPLPADLVVIDESSMVSLPLMARLLSAVPREARLVLVGDPDQLASVEAGAVLADLVAHPGGARVVRLEHTYRFSGAIAELADAIKRGDPDAALAVLRRGDPSVSFHEPGQSGDLREVAAQAGVIADVRAAAQAVTEAATSGDHRGALSALDSHRLLCAHRSGPSGAQAWGDLAAAWTANLAGGPQSASGPVGAWYVGQPLLVTANDYAADLYNGDTGVVVLRDGQLRAAFERGGGALLVSPSRLDDVTTLRAMTIHRAQGSQFNAVTVVLPGAESRIMTRELLYTAVTRARERVRVLATEEAVVAAVTRRVARASGLREAATGAPLGGDR